MRGRRQDRIDFTIFTEAGNCGEDSFFMQLEVGKIVEGKVSGITKFGAFVDSGWCTFRR